MPATGFGLSALWPKRRSPRTRERSTRPRTFAPIASFAVSGVSSCLRVGGRAGTVTGRPLVDRIGALQCEGNHLAEPLPGRAELASAVLLGARAEIDSQRTNVFVETGTVHLLAISGLHVGIVAGVLLVALRFFPLSRAAEFWIVVAGLLPTPC